jgi:hypothetical protein
MKLTKRRRYYNFRDKVVSSSLTWGKNISLHDIAPLFIGTGYNLSEITIAPSSLYIWIIKHGEGNSLFSFHHLDEQPLEGILRLLPSLPFTPL